MRQNPIVQTPPTTNHFTRYKGLRCGSHISCMHNEKLLNNRYFSLCKPRSQIILINNILQSQKNIPYVIYLILAFASYYMLFTCTYKNFGFSVKFNNMLKRQVVFMRYFREYWYQQAISRSYILPFSCYSHLNYNHLKLFFLQTM
jgi:hypothetical protein